jgi:hypothetical protein
LGRSSAGRRRPAAERRRVPPPPLTPSPPEPGRSLATVTTPRVWQGIGYRPLPDPVAARPLFDFAAVAWPVGGVAFGWGAFVAPPDAPERLIGCLVAEVVAPAGLLHGPVVVEGDNPLETAAQLVAAALDHASVLGAQTLFTRPQGLDRVWVRFGFIPVPESTLPAELAGRPGVGLYAWRGGSALWTLREAARDFA